jgi:hypothetical protein
MTNLKTEGANRPSPFSCEVIGVIVSVLPHPISGIGWKPLAVCIRQTSDMLSDIVSWKIVAAAGSRQ